MLWAGRILSVLAAALLLVDASLKLVKPAWVVKGMTDLGYSEQVIFPLGVVLLVCTVLYLIPRTSVLGAILLTGYLGGAVDCHVHAGDAAFHTVFPPSSARSSGWPLSPRSTYSALVPCRS